MKITMKDIGNFKNTIDWLQESMSNKPNPKIAVLAEKGLAALKAATPIDTGETASSWAYEITSDRGLTEISYTNSAHPESEVNVAKLIQLGHVTDSGHYVSPVNYIHPAINGVFGKNGEVLAKEVLNE